MPVIFPPISSATEEGLLAVGGELDLETLYTAYSQGIFPWPISPNSPMTWFCPDPRGILYAKDFHLSKSLKRYLKTCPYTFKFNTNFIDVITQCANVKRAHEEGTWIEDDIIEAFNAFFEAGHAYSIEVYEKDELVGGLYGVCIGKYLTGESMFHIKDNASKVALFILINILIKNDIEFLDTQMVTPIIGSFGAKNIPRDKFLKSLPKLCSNIISREDIFTLQDHRVDLLFQNF